MKTDVSALLLRVRESSRKAGKISTLAGNQQGYVARRQLLALGLSSSAIGRRADLITVHHGVYAVGHVNRTPIAVAHAAVLACGDDAALTDDSAAALWTMRRWPKKPEVSAPGVRRRPGIRTHRRKLSERDVTVNYGMRVTTVVRTIIDIEPRLSDRQAIRLVNDARLRNILGPSALNELLARCPRLARLLDTGQNPTRSGFEDDFVAWLTRHGLPIPTINRRIGSTEADAVFERHGVIVELDTFGTHGDPVSFRADRTRDRANAARNLLPLRLTPEDLTDDEAGRLRAILDGRQSWPWLGGSTPSTS